MASFALVSDFDGTITRNDFYTLIAERYMGPDAMSLWDSYQAGKITHFEAMQMFFSHAPVDEPSLEYSAPTMSSRYRQLPACARLLETNGWDLIIVSAGCSWYIERILQRTGVAAIVHSNPGRNRTGQGTCDETSTRFAVLLSECGDRQKKKLSCGMRSAVMRE